MNVSSTFVSTKVGSRVRNFFRNLDQAAWHTQLQRDSASNKVEIEDTWRLSVDLCHTLPQVHTQLCLSLLRSRLERWLSGWSSYWASLKTWVQIPSTHVHSQSSPDRTEKNTELQPTSEQTHACAYTCLNICVYIFVYILTYFKLYVLKILL